jgi:HTH-type transcriptional regulator/antitoxin HigA
MPQLFNKGMNMNIKPLRSEEDYKAALARLEQIFDASPDSPEGEEAELLILLIDNYENEHYQIETPDPVEAIKIRMEELNLKQKDLVGIIGGKGRVSEILNKRRKLTLEMIRNLTDKLNLSAYLLIKDYTLSK